MADMFDGPAEQARITDYEGCLLLVTPREVEKDIRTAFGDADATASDVVVLDGDHAGREHRGMLLFQKVLQAQLSDRVGSGRMLLGRLGRGVAKQGQDAPWVFEDPTEQDREAARAWIRKHPPF